MQVPLAIAAPAAAAGLAYINAKTSLGGDLSLLGALAKSTINVRIQERRDRVNLFYTLEGHAHARSTANHPFVVYEGREWTYKEVYDIVLRYGTWLKATYKIGPKEIVAMDFMNSPQFVFIWLALWSIGAHPAFINYNLTDKPLLHCVRTSTARLLLVDNEVRDSFSKEVLDELASTSFHNGKGSVEVVFFTPEIESQILQTEGVREPDSTRSGAMGYMMANLIYTSGTTGLPKAAIVSWNKGLLGGRFVSGWMGYKRKDRFYTCMPLYHSSAAVLGFCSTLSIGSTIVIGHKFSTKTFWKEVRESNATIIQYVGETCRYLLAAPPQIDPVTGENLDKKHKVRIAFGNGLRPDIWNRFKERFGIETIAEFYAATEGTSGSWNLSSNDYSRGAIGRNGTLASALLGPSIAIVQLDWETEEPFRDPATNFCRRVPRGDAGELLYRVDAADIAAKFQGYFNNATATSSKIMRDVLAKGDAWFRTGDVVRWDPQGRWFFNDRIGDTFRWKSENVSTSEVAEALGTHPHVLEANVYGVELPNHDGRAGCAAVIFAEDLSPALLDGVAAHAAKSLPKFAVPLFLRVTKEMQATGNNKQQKHLLRVQGVEPGKVGGDGLFWLQGGRYVPFGEREWEELKGGMVRL